MVKQLSYSSAEKPSSVEKKDTPKRFEWSLLRRAIFLNLLVIMVGGCVLAGSYWYYQLLLQWNKQMDTDLEYVEKSHQVLQETQSLIDSDEYKTFLRLKSQGFFNAKALTADSENWRIIMEEQLLHLQERTAAWFKQDKQALAIREASFTYSQPELLQVPMSKEHIGRLTVYGSRLDLQAQLMHEGYMLDLLNYIRTLPIDGLLTLQSCDLSRLYTHIESKQTEQANLKLICVFQWYIARIEARY